MAEKNFNFPPDPKQTLSQELIEEIFPRIDLADKEGTKTKLLTFLDEQKKARAKWENLEGDEGLNDEELLDAYDAQVAAIGKILPQGYAFEPTYVAKESPRWRGTDPFAFLSMAADENNRLKVSANYPTVAHKWETSLMHGTRRTSSSAELPFVLAFGFTPPTGFKTKESIRDKNYNDTIDIVDGDLQLADIREIAIRLRGKAKGQIFPPRFYKLVRPELSTEPGEAAA